MLIKIFIVLMLLAIVASLFSALFMLSRRDNNNHAGIARALTWRIGLSITLFLLLLAGFYFGIIPPEGLSQAPGR